MKLSKKAMNITPSITLSITAKAKKLKAEGVDLVSFGAGEPDFNTPKNIIDAAIKAMYDGKTKYTDASGIVELKEAIRNKLKTENDLEYSNEQIIASTGAKQCLANVFLSILNPGDEVIIATPYWVSYPELIKLADGTPVFINTGKESEYKFTISALSKAISKKSKAIVINTPNNPTGTIYNKEELLEIAKFCEENKLIIISDEIYEKLIYGEEKHVSIASLTKYAYENTVVINGLSKSSAMTGWRFGYAAGPKEIIKLMSSIQSHMTSNLNTITQYAAIEALNGTKEPLIEMQKEFSKRKEIMVSRLKGIEGLEIIEPKGAFYVMVNISSYFGKEICTHKIEDSITFAEAILDVEKVALIPGIGFGLEGYVRLSYAISKEDIEKGIDRLESFIKKLR